MNNQELRDDLQKLFEKYKNGDNIERLVAVVVMSVAGLTVNPAQLTMLADVTSRLLDVAMTEAVIELDTEQGYR